MTARIFNIQNFSTTDGPGIRTVIFFQGCNLKCIWCHNPESWDADPPPAFIKEKCISCGRCASGGECFTGALVPTTRDFTPQGLWELIKDEQPYFKNSGGGITFSGGECALQPDFLKEMVNICRQNTVHTAVDTAGHVPYEWLVRINPDLFLYDIKACSPEKYKEISGVDGVLIWDNLRKLISDGYNVHVRVPCIPGANWDELPEIADRLHKSGITGIELLPYHKLGEGKAAAHKQRVFDAPSEEDMNQAKKIFKLI